MDSVRLGEIFAGQILPSMIGLFFGWKLLCWFRKDDKKDKELEKQTNTN